MTPSSSRSSSAGPAVLIPAPVETSTFFGQMARFFGEKPLIHVGRAADGQIKITHWAAGAASVMSVGPSAAGAPFKLPLADACSETIISEDWLDKIADAELSVCLAELQRVSSRNVVLLPTVTRARSRTWWERACFVSGFRKHALYQAVTSYAALENEGARSPLVLEKIPAEGLTQFPLTALEAERDLHNDMTRVSGRRSDAHIARYILARRYLPESGLVLDAACGLGYGSAVLACGNPDVQVIGLDCSDFAVAYGDANFRPTYPNIRFLTGDVCDLSAYADGSVGLVVSFETIEHLREPELFLREVRRVLKPEGNFICSVPNMWVDETGKDPNPWHFHVFDFLKIVELCGRFLSLRDVFSQTAGGGMKLSNAPRSIRRVNLPMTQSNDQAEWWLVAGSRERLAMPPVRAEAPAETVMVLTHDASHPLYTSWLGGCPYPVVYQTETDVDYEIPSNVGLVISVDCYREPRASLLCKAMERGIPTLLIADGILEYRNTFEHSQISPGSVFQPVLGHKVACLGRSQARILESWGNSTQCEVTGSARFDSYATRKRRVRPTGEPFRVLVMTAITPYFTEEHHERVRQSLLDIKGVFDEGIVIDDVPLLVEWRITKGLQAEIGVETVITDLTGAELAEVLQRVDAVISTPSTSMVEAMLLGLPVAVLDYCNCPHYVQPAWRITAAEQIVPTLVELMVPPAPKLLFQETTLHDTLECTTPAAPRLLALVEAMITIGRRARDQNAPLVFPPRLVPLESSGEAPTENRFALSELYPGHAQFHERDVQKLQVEVGQLRAYAAQLEKSGRSVPVRPVADPAELAKLRAHAQLTLLWRSKLEAAAILVTLNNPKAAISLLFDGLKAVESCRNPDVLLEALTEISSALVPLDAFRARPLADTALKLAERMGRRETSESIRQLIQRIPSLSTSGVPTGKTAACAV